MHSSRVAIVLVAMEKRSWIAALSVVMLAAQASWSPTSTAFAMPADDQRPDNVKSVRIGRTVAATHCAACHAIGRKGSSPNPKAPRFPLIAERYPADNPAIDLVDGIVIRHRGMPEFRLTEDQTDGLVAYLRNVSRKYRPKAQP
ncbi:MAG: c-type cytochrome [Beijerinckiaceae bacterium]